MSQDQIEAVLRQHGFVQGNTKVWEKNGKRVTTTQTGDFFYVEDTGPEIVRVISSGEGAAKFLDQFLRMNNKWYVWSNRFIDVVFLALFPLFVFMIGLSIGVNQANDGAAVVGILWTITYIGFLVDRYMLRGRK